MISPVTLLHRTSTMNRLFYVEELVQWIAFSVDEGSTGSTSLLALACCCKALEGPVMDILWQRQKFLPVILRTLPVDCWTFTNKVYVSGLYLNPSGHLFPIVQRLVRTPTTREWERFRVYTGRVVELCVGRESGMAVSSETIAFLGMQSTLDPLWPRLTSLRLSNGLGWDSVASTLAFLSPKINTLALILPRDTSILLQPILSITSDRCQCVQELVLDVVVDNPQSPHWVGGLISACRDTVRTLEIHSPFKVEYLPIIANLPQLRKLLLERAHFSTDIPLGAFPVLEHFTFLRFQGRRLQHFLKRMCTTNLKEARIISTDAIDFKKSVKALSKFSTSLEYLEIWDVTGLELLRIPALGPPFTNLRNLHLRCFRWGENFHNPCGFRPSDRAIAELGASMPNLTNLSLGNPTCPDLQCVTFLSLVSLAKACHDLDTLEIKINFGTMVTLPLFTSEEAETNLILEETWSSGCRLRKLVLGLSILTEHPDSGWLVAVGLGRIFPLLSEVEGYGFDRSKWEQIGKNVRMSRQVLHNVEAATSLSL